MEGAGHWELGVMWALRVVVWGLGLLICNIPCGAPIYHLGDLGAKVLGKSKTVRHLGHQHQVTLLVARFLMCSKGKAFGL